MAQTGFHPLTTHRSSTDTLGGKAQQFPLLARLLGQRSHQADPRKEVSHQVRRTRRSVSLNMALPVRIVQQIATQAQGSSTDDAGLYEMRGNTLLVWSHAQRGAHGGVVPRVIGSATFEIPAHGTDAHLRRLDWDPEAGESEPGLWTVLERLAGAPLRP